MKKFDYIAAFYLGPRRSTFYNELGTENKLFLIKEHIKYLQTQPKGLNNVYFVFNTDNSTSSLSKAVENYIKTFPLNINVIFRDNTGLSYGAWEEILFNIKDSTTSDYAFLIEDDYIPTSPNSIEPFLKAIQDGKNVGYVAQLINSNVRVGASNDGDIHHHAAISNGLISYQAIKATIEKHHILFKIRRGESNYTDGTFNQTYFLNHLINSGYQLVSLSENHLHPFYDVLTEGIVFYGNRKGKILIKPILSDITISPLTKDNLPFLLEIRNDDSTRKYLENNSIFTLEECQKWFSSTNPEWYIISHNNTKVGYIRSTPNGEVGVDIHPDFRRKGYARKAYEEYLRYRKFATLWVFEDNFALKLYTDLGFTSTGINKKIRNRSYIQMSYYNEQK
jgi:ribosomal protein S18 acetylase RimI-like enzyme